MKHKIGDLGKPATPVNWQELIHIHRRMGVTLLIIHLNKVEQIKILSPDTGSGTGLLPPPLYEKTAVKTLKEADLYHFNSTKNQEN